MFRQHPISTLFPYTTLFRSLPERRRPGLAAEQLVLADAGQTLLAELVEKYAHVFLLVGPGATRARIRSEEHTSELQSLRHLVCRLLLEKKKKIISIFRRVTM